MNVDEFKKDLEDMQTLSECGQDPLWSEAFQNRLKKDILSYRELSIEIELNIAIMERIAEQMRCHSTDKGSTVQDAINFVLQDQLGNVRAEDRRGALLDLLEKLSKLLDGKALTERDRILNGYRSTEELQECAKIQLVRYSNIVIKKLIQELAKEEGTDESTNAEVKDLSAEAGAAAIALHYSGYNSSEQAIFSAGLGMVMGEYSGACDIDWLIVVGAVTLQIGLSIVLCTIMPIGLDVMTGFNTGIQEAPLMKRIIDSVKEMAMFLKVGLGISAVGGLLVGMKCIEESLNSNGQPNIVDSVTIDGVEDRENTDAVGIEAESENEARVKEEAESENEEDA